MNCVDDRAIIDQVLDIAALTTGVLLGVFFLGTLTRHVDQRAALAGFVSGLGVDLFCKFGLAPLTGIVVAGPWYGLIGCATTFGAGLLASALRRRPPERTGP
jgi:Na+/proline symporter